MDRAWRLSFADSQWKSVPVAGSASTPPTRIRTVHQPGAVMQWPSPLNRARTIHRSPAGTVNVVVAPGRSTQWLELVCEPLASFTTFSTGRCCPPICEGFEITPATASWTSTVARTVATTTEMVRQDLPIPVPFRQAELHARTTPPERDRRYRDPRAWFT